MSSEILKGKNGKWAPNKGTPWYKTPFVEGTAITALLKRGGKVRKTKKSERMMKRVERDVSSSSRKKEEHLMKREGSPLKNKKRAVKKRGKDKRAKDERSSGR